MRKFDSKRKGFTLIELLIVIVVIGILSAMMMLSSTEAVTSAKASNVVSNLRNFKTAALAYYVDHIDDWNKTTAPTVVKMTDIEKYMSNSSSSTTDAKTITVDGVTYELLTPVPSGSDQAASAQWYLKAQITDTKVQEKLAGRAKSVGLLKAGTYDAYKPSANDAHIYTQAEDVYMFVR